MEKTFYRLKMPVSQVWKGLIFTLFVTLILSFFFKIDIIRSVIIGMAGGSSVFLPLIFNRLIKYKITDDNYLTGSGINIDIRTINTIIISNKQHKIVVVNKPVNSDKYIRNIFYVEDPDGFTEALLRIKPRIETALE